MSTIKVPNVSAMSTTKQLVSSSWSSIGTKYPFELIMLSEAGKPIYCYNKSLDESRIVSLAGVCQALTNFFNDSSNGDSLKCIKSLSGIKVTFALKSPLIIILVSHKLTPINEQLIINQSFSQMVSILTLKQLSTIFNYRPTFDLRSVLSRSDTKLIDLLLDECLLKNGTNFTKTIKFNGNQSDKKSCSIHGYLTSVPMPVTSSNSGHQQQQHVTAILNNNRIMIPVLPLTPAMRDSVTSMIETSINSVKSEVLFALLFQRKVSASIMSTNYDLNSTQLVTIYNHNSKSAKLFPEDVQLLMTHVINSDGQLSSAESLWIPICLPHLDSSAFIHCHISYLTSNMNRRTPSPLIIEQDNLLIVEENQEKEEECPNKEVAKDISSVSSSAKDAQSSSALASADETTKDEEKLCFVILSVEKDDFHKCQQIKDTFADRLNKIKLIPWPLSCLNDVQQLQGFTYFSHKPVGIIYRCLPYIGLTNFHPLISLINYRMAQSNYKTIWFSSDRHQVTILASSSSAGLFMFQFDSLITHSDALIVASKINFWIKKEEDKIKIKDYQ